MSETATYHLPPSGRPPLDAQAARAELARNLAAAMARKGWNQSQLARAAFGEYLEPGRGRVVARGRDRVSSYLRARTRPDPKTLARLAEVLGTTPERLAPCLFAGAAHEVPELDIRTVPGRDGKAVVLVRINKILPLALLPRLTALLAEADAEAGA